MQVSGRRAFAGVIFYLVGAFNVIGGLGALFRDEVFVAGNEVLIADTTAWGWLLLVLGLVQLAVGFGIFRGLGWARAVGVILASLSAVLHVAFLVAFPAFSLITIALAVVVIYGLVMPDEPAR
ncbi:MAG TPA: hypothetical protein VD769_10020 [Gaiellaceae bacterium]|nr:hypothetical protein [Gaiellaceae bacterium]